jgi:hypothetical protein
MAPTEVEERPAKVHGLELRDFELIAEASLTHDEELVVSVSSWQAV